MTYTKLHQSRKFDGGNKEIQQFHICCSFTETTCCSCSLMIFIMLVVYFVNPGTDSSEAAMLMAMLYTSNLQMISQRMQTDAPCFQFVKTTHEASFQFVKTSKHISPYQPEGGSFFVKVEIYSRQLSFQEIQIVGCRFNLMSTLT